MDRIRRRVLPTRHCRLGSILVGFILAAGAPSAATIPDRAPAERPLLWPAGAPNDPAYGPAQASYLNTVGVPSAWDDTAGSENVVVAVLDSGVDASHPDLAGRVVSGRNVVAGNDDTADELGHGTNMAGISGVVTNNGLGIAGVAWL